MKLARFEGNPILAPRPGSNWESAGVSNPAAWCDGLMVRLLYRAEAGSDDRRSCFGLAESGDGFRFRRLQEQPVFGPSVDGFDGGCVEDARIVRFGETFFMTYAARMFPAGGSWRKPRAPVRLEPPLPPESPLAARKNLTRSGLAVTNDFRKWYRLGPVTRAADDNRDAVLFPDTVGGRFVMLHRPAGWVGERHGCDRPSIWISFSEDLLSWRQDSLLATPMLPWESREVGGGPPPIRTERGWLMLYYGMDDAGACRVGAMMLDLHDPRQVIARAPEPILEPEAPCEREGLVPDTVFPCGNVVIGDRLFVYYGGAATVCCVATSVLDDLVAHVMAHPCRP